MNLGEPFPALRWLRRASGQGLMRQNLRRRFPDAPEAEIERRLVEWLHRRPGAEHGDGEGRPSRSFERFE